MALFVFVCDFGVNYQFLRVVVQRFYRVLEFTGMEPLAVYEFPDLSDELADPYESLFLLPM